MELERIQLAYGTAEWKAFRRSGIGGSDAAAAIGRSGFKTNVRLWEEKTGRAEDRDISDNPRVQYGKLAEEHLTALFALDYPQYKVIDSKDTVYRRGFMFASLDSELEEIGTGRRGFLEDKTAEINSLAAAEKWADGHIPDTYYIQILHYLIVTGFEFCLVKARLIDTAKDGEKLITEKHIRYERKELFADMRYLYREELKFWRYVQDDKRPPRILPQI